MSHIGLAVALCLPHRGTCTIFSSKREHFPDTAEIEWEQRRPLLQRRKPERQDPRDLHEEERGTFL